MRRHYLISVALLALLLTVGHTNQQVARILNIVVRDINGNPLPGVNVLLREPGSYVWEFVEVVTDENGVATFEIDKFEYIVTFEGFWGGRPFIRAENQNAGILSTDEYGGFGVYLDPAEATYQVLFVVGLDEDDDLVPLFDLAESVDDVPEPYLYEDTDTLEADINPEAIVGDVAFEPLVTPVAVVTEEVIAEADETAEEDKRQNPLITTIVLIFGLIVSLAVLALMWFNLYMQSRGGGAGGKEDT